MVKLVALLTTFSAGIFLTRATEAYLTANKAYCISEQAPAGVVPPINPSLDAHRNGPGGARGNGPTAGGLSRVV